MSSQILTPMIARLINVYLAARNYFLVQQQKFEKSFA
jgi:hypothetical protein